MRPHVAVLLAAIALPASAVADDEPTQPPGTLQGPMAVERTHDGFMIAPDVQVGRVGGTTTTMAGAYGGWMFQNTILVGGAGYWQLNRSAPRKMDYLGGIVEWLARTDRPIGYGARARVGGGWATLSSNLTGLPLDVDLNGRSFFHEPIFGRLVPVDLRFPVPGRVEFRQNFGVFEPQGNLLVNIGPRLRVRAAAGYRFIGASHGWSDQLKGATGSVGLEIGGTTTTRVTP